MTAHTTTALRHRELGLTLSLAALGSLIAPIVHAVGVRCWVYLPVHLAPLLAGLVLGARRGALIGATVAVADLMLGGKLEGPRAHAVMIELVIYGLVAGALRSMPVTAGSSLRALVCAMLAGRLAYLLLGIGFGRTVSSCLRGLFLTPYPGILLQLIVLPWLSVVLSRWLRGSTQPA